MIIAIETDADNVVPAGNVAVLSDGWVAHLGD